METVFPPLFTFSFFAPTLLRICIALIFAHDIKHYRHATTKNRVLGVVAGILAILLFVGASVQVDALVGLIYIGWVRTTKHEGSIFMKREVAFLSVAILLSLLALGAGALGVDRPY